MNSYKKFQIKELLSQEIFYYLNDKNLIYNNEIFYNDISHKDFLQQFPSIHTFLMSNGTHCIGIGLIKIFYNKVAIHQDNSASNGGAVRINWPVVNCEHSETIFYENFNGIKETKLLPNGTVFHEYRDKDCREIDKFCLDSPAALDVSVPHRVWCEKFPRVSLSFHLRPSPNWLLK